MRFQLFFCCILFLTGCGVNEVVIRKVAVEIPGRVDTVEAEEFKVEDESTTLRSFDELRTGSTQGDRNSLIEETFYRGISFKEGSKKDTAIIAEFIPAKKQFIIKRFPVKDTVYVTDTLRMKPTDILLRGNDNTERLIWIISFALTSIIIIGYKGYLNDRKSKKQA